MGRQSDTSTTGESHDAPVAESQSDSAQGFPAPPRWMNVTVAAAVVLYALFYSSICILRHHGLNSSAFDLAIQDQVIWNTSRGRLFASSFESTSFLGDHMALIALVLAPLGWLPGVEWLLIAQSAALASGGWALYRMTCLHTASVVLRFVFPLAFLVYPLLGFINRFDFHFLAFAAPCLMFMILFLHERRIAAATLAAVLAAACREEVGLAVAGVALVFARQRSMRRWGFGAAGAGSLWSLLAMFVLIPAIRGTPPDSLYRYAWLGDGPMDIAATILAHPIDVFDHLLSDPTRRQTVGMLLWPLAFLPLAAPLRALAAVLPLAVCLLPDHRPTNSIYYHYLASVLPIIWWSALGGATRLERWAQARNAGANASRLIGAGMLIGCLSALVRHDPVFTVTRSPDWHVQVLPARRNTNAFREAKTMIPPGAAVVAGVALAPHLSRREHIAALGGWRTFQSPDYYVLDVSDFRWFGHYPNYAESIARLIRSPNLGIRFCKDGIVLLERGAEDRCDASAVLAELFANAASRAAPAAD